MTTSIATPTPVAPPAVPRLARLPVLVVAAVVAVAHLAVAAIPARWLDEALMLAIGRHHLDWGSADQPPVAPLLAALADAVAPGSHVVLALPAVAATAGAVVVAALIARELGGDARAQTLTALAQATGLWAALSGHWLTPYALEPLQWLVIGWLLVRWQRTRDDRLLLVLGLVAGVAAQTKFQVLLLCAVLLVVVAVLGPRELLRRPSLWGGVGIAGLIAAPTLIWQAVNGWPQLAMGSVVVAEAEYLYGGRVGVALQIVVLAGVLGVGLGAVGLVTALRDPALRWLGATTLVLFVLFVATPGRPYYLAGLYGLLAAVGAVTLMRRREAGRTRGRWVAWPASVVSVVAAAGMLALSVPFASPALADAYAASTARTLEALPPEQRERTAVFGESYIVAAFLDTAGPELGLPAAHSLNRSYGFFDPPPAETDTVLHLGDPTALRPWFTDARVVAVVPNTGGVDLGGRPLPDTPLWLLTGREAPWPTIMEEARDLAVG